MNSKLKKNKKKKKKKKKKKTMRLSNPMASRSGDGGFLEFDVGTTENSVRFLPKHGCIIVIQNSRYHKFNILLRHSITIIIIHVKVLVVP